MIISSLSLSVKLLFNNANVDIEQKGNSLFSSKTDKIHRSKKKKLHLIIHANNNNNSNVGILLDTNVPINNT